MNCLKFCQKLSFVTFSQLVLLSSTIVKHLFHNVFACKSSLNKTLSNTYLIKVDESSLIKSMGQMHLQQCGTKTLALALPLEQDVSRLNKMYIAPN